MYGTVLSMKFVALISGGKDSCFNILHCLKQGHQLIALANLYPHDEAIQDLNSFMFQTVGHDLISLYSKCCDVPLFRKPIKVDSSINKELNYVTVSKDDEIEVLYQLLCDVKSKLPELQAVSVGAILSSYQRVRVEDVCNRLGLTVLSYLWQRDQSELLNEMVTMSAPSIQHNNSSTSSTSSTSSNNKSDGDSRGEGYFDARLIKVAAIGLNSCHLNMNLPQIQPIMVKLNNRYEVNVCGEGGEFETMVLDSPFFKDGYLKWKNMEVTSDSKEHNDGVYNARLIVDYQPRKLSDDFLKHELQRLPEPTLLDAKWQELLNNLKENDTINKLIEKFASIELSTSSFSQSLLPSDYKFTPNVSFAQVDDLLYISNLTSTLPFAETNGIQHSLETHMLNIFKQLEEILVSRSLYPCQIISSSLILNNIENFGRINRIYSEWFSTQKWGPLPPSRACVGSNLLGPENPVQLSVIVDLNSDKVCGYQDSKIKVNKNKNGLHVQSRSYWAPCNIGPYSQATWLNSDQANKVASISGQIALIPKSMEMLPKSEYLTQSVLSLKHFNTLKETISTERQLFMICFVDDTNMVPIVAKTWSLYCREMSLESSLWFDKEDEPLESLIIVKISELPRNALCEWSGVACESLHIEDMYDDYSEDEQKEEGKASKKTEPKITNEMELYNDIIVSKGNNQRHFVTGFCNNANVIISFLNEIKNGHLTLYFNPIECNSSPSLVLDQLYSKGNVELYPVQKVYDYKGKDYKYGFQYSY